jgi:hypothetical protein
VRGFWKRSTGLLAELELAACRQEEPETTCKETNRAVLEWSIASRELVPNMVGGFVFMLVRLHPERQAELDERYSTSLAALPDSAGKTEGIQAGEAAASQVTG